MTLLLRLILPALFLAMTAVAPGSAQTMYSPNVEIALVPMHQWAAPGSTAVVAVRQDIRPGWHTYWRNPGDSGGATELTWTLPAGVSAGPILWPLPERQPVKGLMNYGYSRQVYLPVPIEVPRAAKAGTMLPLSVKVLSMVCSDEICVPDERSVTLDLPIRDGVPPLIAGEGAAIERIVDAAPRPADIDAHIARDGADLVLTLRGAVLRGTALANAYLFPFEGGIVEHPAAQRAEREGDDLILRMKAGGAVLAGGLAKPVQGVVSTSQGAWEITAQARAPPGRAGGTSATLFAQAALFALIGGLILNLMPCVFPILAMKAASLSASAHSPRTARRDGIAFLLGVLTTFILLAGALLVLRAGGEAAGWGFQLQNPAVTAALALVMLAVGLNLSGVFAVAMPGSGAGSGLTRLPGGTGAFFTGVLAVVVAAPCTAPFMAFALGAALVMPAPMALAVFAMLGLGLALPYLVISLSPGVLRRFPKPGPWMDRLKSILAFPMYGAALWLVWVFARQTSGEALALILAGGLLLAFGLTLWGWRQNARMAGRGARAATAVSLLSLLTAAAVTLSAASLAPGAESSGEAATETPWSPDAVATARAEGKVVFVNFTADWCVTCKVNERAALATGGTRALFADAGAVYLVADWTRRDDAIARELERFGRSGVPLYLVYAPGKAEPEILPQLLTPGIVADAVKRAGEKG
ncbi:MAG: thioredoxin family protein [Sphingopyxis sp.]|uniref:protein-disulfide reductase DsbD family protein n=1 Tax=Sphingopyxis sp. TaxID=1908224 RepID=UPI001A296C92|nr:protein-disulfide reductase DsbD domain-containing protein [Sphingopyxis sp.]MBJ7500260.1 thioredoxin family protein [Sphingopyxis sp.]